MPKTKPAMKKGKRSKKRIVMGEGYPWYFVHRPGEGWPSGVKLYKTSERGCAEPMELVTLKYGNTGNWNRVRLVLEVLE